MIYRKFFLFATFLFFICNVSFSATIIVTSNADTGPGTLREALSNAAANGSATADVIQFNLPGSLVSDRTIRLKSQLPALTSNVTIDGSTQPGIAFGVSDARVIIEPEISPANFSGLYVNGDINSGGTPTTTIAIYGLYIRNFANITNLASPDYNQGSGILIQGNVSGITIGAPGKGNVICGNINGIVNTNIYYNTGLSSVQVQSNIIGLLDDGFTAASNINGVNLTLDHDATIGGGAANMGNIISANVIGVSITRSYNFTVTPSLVTIQNNMIGTDYTGKADFRNIPIFQQSAFLKAYGINITATNTTATITSNLVSGQNYCGIYIENAAFTINGNKIGTDIAGTKDLGNREGIRAGTNSSGTIGGSTSADINYIGFSSYGIEALNGVHALITRNSIFCNTDYGISVTSSNYQVPFVQVLNFGSTGVSGLATPNCNIELFFSDDCGTICQGKTYITTVKSDVSGNWTYSGTISSAVIATATDANNNTSPFSSLVIQNTDVVVKNYTCAYQGSLTIQQKRSGLLFHWDKKETNGSLTSIGDSQNIQNLIPGVYQLTTQYPGGCQKITQLFEIKDDRVTIQNLIIPTPQCREKSFAFDVNYSGGTGNVTFAWKDKNGNIISTNKQANLPAGTFTVTISDDAGCALQSTAITITAKPGPDYDLSTMQVNPARCGVADGSITNITTTVGIGTLTYQWLDANGAIVATTKDLVKVRGGSYTLVLMDQSQCSPYSTPPIFISETNSVNISDGVLTPATCGNNNGSITNVQVTNANQFQWYDAQGNPIATNQNNLDIFNLTDGTYHLYALNTVTQCSNDKYFTVNRIIPQIFIAQVMTATPTTCGLNNGAIMLQFAGKILPSTYQWTNSAGANVGNTASLSNLPPDKYTLTLTDANGCISVFVKDYEITATPLLEFSLTNNPLAKADQCDQQLGSVTGVDVTGGVLPYNYAWTDIAGKTVGTGKDLLNVGKGTYQLVVTDATNCAVPKKLTITVGNNEFVPNEPVLNDRKICDPQMVGIYVNNPVKGTYNLYADATSPQPFKTSSAGQFVIQVNASIDYYVSYSIGSCESPRTKTHIEVVLVDIQKPNLFTPNGDNINDYWKITGLEKFPGSIVRVFSRYGLQVFESKDYAKPFDGTYKGEKLPAGVYYYIINLNTTCNLLSGSLTIVR
jgi:gliding motility-associated-like protein